MKRVFIAFDKKGRPLAVFSSAKKYMAWALQYKRLAGGTKAYTLAGARSFSINKSFRDWVNE